MANPIEIPEKLITLLVEELGVSPDECIVDASLMDDLGANSLDLMGLAMRVEEEWEIKVEDAEFEKVLTVAQLAELIQDKTK